MMNAKLVLTLVMATLMIVTLLILLPTAAHGQTPPGFIITNADVTTYVTTTLTMPIPNIPPRFVVEHANGIRFYNVPPISSTLLTLMRQVPDRFVIQYANADRFYSFIYPAAMISDTIPPTITEAVTCTINSTDSITISWMTNEYADGAVLYGTLPGVYSQTVSNPLYFRLHSITITGLRRGIDYHYVVRDADRSRNVYVSPEYTCKIPPPLLPNPPSSLTATAVSETQINLTWLDNSRDETGFRNERSLNAMAWTGIYTTSANVITYSNTRLTCSTLYHYRIRAYRQSDDQYSPYSNVDSAITGPCHPTNLTATVASRTQINLSWQDNSPDESRFYIERSPNGTTGWSQIATTDSNVTNFSNTGLWCGTPYYYRVRAYRQSDAQPSTYSNKASNTTLPCVKVYLPTVLKN
jgi:hypothetical protein